MRRAVGTEGAPLVANADSVDYYDHDEELGDALGEEETLEESEEGLSRVEEEGEDEQLTENPSMAYEASAAGHEVSTPSIDPARKAMAPTATSASAMAAAKAAAMAGRKTAAGKSVNFGQAMTASRSGLTSTTVSNSIIGGHSEVSAGGKAGVSVPRNSRLDAYGFAEAADEQTARPPRVTKRTNRMNEVKVRHMNRTETDTKPWIQRAQADVFFATVIMLQAVNMGVETELCLNSPSGVPSPTAEAILLILEAIFTFIYVIELCLRLRAEGCSYLSWRNPLGIFDTFLVIFSVVDLILGVASVNSPVKFIASMRVFRLLRLGRIFRLLHLFPELQLLVSGLAKTFRAAGWAILLLLLLCYCGALFCAEMLGHADDKELRFYFGSIPRSLLTHIKLAMVEAWPDISKPMFESNSMWRFYVVVFICIANIQLLNVVTGVVCEQVISSGANLPPPDGEQSEREKKTFARQLKVQWMIQGLGSSIEDYLELLKTKEVQEILQEHLVTLPLERKHLLLLMTEDSKLEDAIPFEEFVNALMRLKGEQDRLSLALRYDIRKSHRNSLKSISEFQSGLQKHIHQNIDEPGRKLFKQASYASHAISELEKWLSAKHTGKAFQKDSCATELAQHDEDTLEDALTGALNDLQASVGSFQHTLVRATAFIESPVLSARRCSRFCEASDACTQTSELEEHKFVSGECQTEESRMPEEDTSKWEGAPLERSPSMLEVPEEPRPEVPTQSVVSTQCVAPQEVSVTLQRGQREASVTPQRIQQEASVTPQRIEFESDDFSVLETDAERTPPVLGTDAERTPPAKPRSLAADADVSSTTSRQGLASSLRESVFADEADPGKAEELGTTLHTPGTCTDAPRRQHEACATDLRQGHARRPSQWRASPSPTRLESLPKVKSSPRTSSAKKPSKLAQPGDDSPDERRSFLTRLAKGQLHERDIDRIASKAPPRSGGAVHGTTSPSSGLDSQPVLGDHAGTGSSIDPVSLAKRRRCLKKLADRAGSVSLANQRPVQPQKQAAI